MKTKVTKIDVTKTYTEAEAMAVIKTLSHHMVKKCMARYGYLVTANHRDAKTTARMALFALMSKTEQPFKFRRIDEQTGQ